MSWRRVQVFNAIKHPFFGHNKGEALYLPINHFPVDTTICGQHVQEDLKLFRLINCFVILTALRQSEKKIDREVKIFCPYELLRFFLCFIWSQYQHK